MFWVWCGWGVGLYVTLLDQLPQPSVLRRVRHHLQIKIGTAGCSNLMFDVLQNFARRV